MAYEELHVSTSNFDCVEPQDNAVNVYMSLATFKNKKYIDICKYNVPSIQICSNRPHLAKEIAIMLTEKRDVDINTRISNNYECTIKNPLYRDKPPLEYNDSISVSIKKIFKE